MDALTGWLENCFFWLVWAIQVYVNAFCREERLQVSERLQRGEVAGMDAPFLYRMSDFCPCPRGDSHTDSRLYDAIRAGCIPVLFDWV